MLLLTAFRPFGTEPDDSPRTINVSREALVALRREFDDALGYLVMSVDDNCTHQFDAMHNSQPWDAVILMGEAGGDGPVRFERTASDPDDASATSVRRSRIVTEQLASSCGAACTDQVGRYFCNAIYFHALGVCEKAIFIHLPKDRPPGNHVAVVRKLIKTQL
ncbi:MAG: hypothetical protein KAS72_10945 [Phycisphaerales bacterium]|nr:hypothetical protein [Phycisphaerales bacterium]